MLTEIRAGKATGDDGITRDHPKAKRDIDLENITAIHNNSDVKGFKTNRPISLMTAVYKLFG